MTDPRPRVQGTPPEVVGVACTACHHPMPTPRPACAACGGPVAEARFGPAGVIWSSTVVRIPVGDRQPPYALAYVDLEDGPRVLAHVAGAVEAPAVGSAVELVAPVDGDVTVEVIA
ncbi:OB-fold domain-containing protein [Nocardioides sp. AE5]|uniref:Zn-ribbon domain-containing OB-fold protein n=1 Tax=Nocardioides sp. AE5 TaxID=2962573 RepID=UPI002880F861|nr:OB-fold domain-containing protein [Nocardioides sp. AE5]MDT0201697.1 OB-fold domain-containing protein [Nocardioides sp. AE5]